MQSNLPPLPPGFQLDNMPPAPFNGRPVIQQGQDPYKERDQRLQEDAAARAREDAHRREMEWNATHNPDGSPKQTAGTAQLKQIPTNGASGLQANLETLRSVEAALASLKGRPESIGPGTGALGDTFTQFNDPKGQDVRSRVGKIGAVTIHDLSGAAVSATEAPRFQPFVPTVTDRPEIAQKKLEQFREALRAQINEQLHFYSPDNGYMPYKSPQADAFLQAGQQPPNEQAPPTPTTTERGFGVAPSGSTPTESGEDFRNQLFSAMRGGKIKSAADIKAFEEQYNGSHHTGWHVDADNPDTKRAISAALAGKKFNIDTPRPNISDAHLGAGPSGVRGAASVALSGLRDKIVAAGDALQNNSPYDYELQRQYAISDYDQANHPVANAAGQILGGFALPMGEMRTPGQIVGKSALAGAAYNTGSSRSLSDVPANALMGAAAGAAGAEFLGAGFGGRAVAGRNALLGPRAEMVVPPLVDEVSGELNQPMDAMKPAQRVAQFRAQGIESVTPGMAGGRSARVLEQGLNNLPGSAGLMEDVNATTSAELSRARTNVAQKFGSSKTMNEGGAELQRGAKERIERGRSVIGKAYAAIPIADTAPAAKTSTINTLQRLTGRFQSNPKLAEAMHDPKLANYLDAFESGDISWQDLKEFRSAIGEKIGEMRFGESSSTSDLRALYAGLSEDMRATAAQMGPRASRAFERANTLNRQNEEMIQGALTRILGKDGNMTPEKAANAVQAMTQGGKATGDLKTLAQIRAATVKSGAWDEIAATLIHLGGQPAKSSGRSFSPETFVRWYSDMSEPARKMLFKPELRNALDQFVAVNQQLSKVRGLANTSNTTPTMIGSGVLAAGGVAAVSHPTTLLAIAGGGIANYSMGKLWTNPKFVNLVTGYGRAVRSGNPSQMEQVGKGFAKLISTNPELREPLVAFQRQLMNHANDNVVGRAAASPDANADENKQ